jgi:hypothetical protein
MHVFRILFFNPLVQIYQKQIAPKIAAEMERFKRVYELLRTEDQAHFSGVLYNTGSLMIESCSNPRLLSSI